MSFELHIRRKRTDDRTVTLYEEDGTTGVALASGDRVRFKMWRRDQATPVIDMDNVAATANGSVAAVTQLTAPAIVTLRFAQGDMDVDPGWWEADLSIVDDSETAPADAIKHVESGQIFVHETGGGDVGTS